MNAHDETILAQHVDAMLRRDKKGKRADRRERVRAEIRTADDGSEWALFGVKLRDTNLDDDELPLWLQRE